MYQLQKTVVWSKFLLVFQRQGRLNFWQFLWDDGGGGGGGGVKMLRTSIHIGTPLREEVGGQRLAFGYFIYDNSGQNNSSETHSFQ